MPSDGGRYWVSTVNPIVLRLLRMSAKSVGLELADALCLDIQPDLNCHTVGGKVAQYLLGEVACDLDRAIKWDIRPPRTGGCCSRGRRSRPDPV